MEVQAQESNRLRRLFKPTCLVLAFWPVWRWYALRTIDCSDEPWGLVALATAAYFLFFNGAGVIAKQSFLPASVGLFLMAIYVGTFAVAPNLVQAIITMAVLWLILPGGRTREDSPGLCGLLLISLPVIPSFNFYGGYPLRLITAAGARCLLDLLGLNATQQGTMLAVNDKLVAIDAPCSGVSMLWVSGYIIFLTAAIYKLRWQKTALLCLAGLLVILVCNVLRASALVIYDLISSHYKAIDLVALEPQAHTGVGLLLFAFSSATICYLAQLLSQREKAPFHPLKESGDLIKLFRFIALDRVASFRQRLDTPRVRRLGGVLGGSLCLLAAIVPFLAHPVNSMALVFEPPVWPRVIAGSKVTAVPSLPEETAFARDFPGVMKRFTDGSSEYFVRVVHKETRQLHPSSDCFRGMGYAIEFRPLIVTADGARWNSFIASKNGHNLRVMERFYDNNGQSWTDVSAWYWACVLGQSRGPWWAVTVASPMDNQKQP